MPPVGFEPTISAGELPQTYALNRAATGTGRCHIDTINSPDDGHMAARKMHKMEINTHEKELCVKLVIYKEVQNL